MSVLPVGTPVGPWLPTLAIRGYTGAMRERRYDSRINVDPEYFQEFRSLKLRYEANTRGVVSWTDFLKYLVSRALPDGVVDEGKPE